MGMAFFPHLSAKNIVGLQGFLGDPSETATAAVTMAAPWGWDHRHHHLHGTASSTPSRVTSGKWIHVNQAHLEIRENNIFLPCRPITGDLH